MSEYVTITNNTGFVDNRCADIQFSAGSTPIVTIHPDGNIVLGPGQNLTDASRYFWRQVAGHGLGVQVENRRLRAGFISATKAVKTLADHRAIDAAAALITETVLREKP